MLQYKLALSTWVGCVAAADFVLADLWHQRAY